MDQFLADASSTHWWLTVVVVGIVINILSSYIKSIFETLLASISSHWRYKQEKRTAEEQKIIELLSEDKELKLVYALNENRFRTRSVGFFVLGLMFIVMLFNLDSGSVLSFSICAIMALVSIILGLNDHRYAGKVQTRVEQSTGGLDKINT
ncbi:hypothetical protein ACKVFH_001781 [Vibrio cholerae]|nr:hypothetical protein [Vibrio cholerae]HDI3318736.1 hypothetical protein [Vibrio cholerae]